MFRDTLLQERQGISSLLNELFQVKVKLEQQIRSIENTFDEIRKLIPPVSLSRFLLCLEKNKYRKDAAKVWSFWESVVKEHMDKSTEIIRKQIKKTTNEGWLWWIRVTHLIIWTRSLPMKTRVFSKHWNSLTAKRLRFRSFSRLSSIGKYRGSKPNCS